MAGHHRPDIREPALRSRTMLALLAVPSNQNTPALPASDSLMCWSGPSAGAAEYRKVAGMEGLGACSLCGGREYTRPGFGSLDRTPATARPWGASWNSVRPNSGSCWSQSCGSVRFYIGPPGGR